MKASSGRIPRGWARAARAAAAVVVVGGVGAASGCSTPLVLPPTAFKVDLLSGASGVDKVDLVLVVDNSPGMADKQAILALAIPDLLRGLLDPSCLDDATNLPIATQPNDPTAACPAGSTRAFRPVLDAHIGVLSSSLGTFGADGCPAGDVKPCAPGATNDDHGHLVTRSDPCGEMAPVATYQNLGFLAWDPRSALTPPGEAALGDPTAAPPVPGLTTSLHDLVTGDGQFGCEFESQNEAWYRFLVDPTPYQSIALVNGTVRTTGIDMTLLQQRADFLRSDSLLAIIDVSDESDASIKEFSSYPLFAQTSLHLPLPRAECAGPKGATDPCCASCGQSTPAGCPMDPACQGGAASYTAATENVALRGFGLIGHKARYGIEFFYPPSRYVAALTSVTVTDSNGKSVPNPIYSVLDKNLEGASIRDPGMVFYAAVVGVPWQLLARRDQNGVPDLVSGVNSLAPADPTQQGGFKSAAELALLDAEGNTFWDDIAGDPESYVPARSPFMVESTTPREGTDPVTGAAMSQVTIPNGGGAMVGGSLLNDHERTIPLPPGDIEYACVFPMLDPIDCSVPGAVCDCPPPGASGDNPLCAPNPNDSGHFTLQTKAKAYPGIKHLAIARGLGPQGIAASICAKQLTDPTADDFGYRPAMKAVLERLTPALKNQCLPLTLTPGSTGEVACFVLEATKVPASAAAACNACTTPGRQPVSMSDPDLGPAVESALQSPLAETGQWNCFCEIPQTTGPTGANAGGGGLEDCQTNPVSTANGWCYVDPAAAPAAEVAGEKQILSRCPPDTASTVRFVGTGAPAPGAAVFIACDQD